MSYTLSTKYRAKSKNARIRYLVIHYTAVDLAESLQLLTEGKVSAHYLIPEAESKHPDLIYQLVDENERAWHAGVSAWQDSTALNDSSIGIELVNPGFTEANGQRTWYAFQAQQINLLIALVKDILVRHSLHPTCIVAHSDIAPGRKSDPGPLFPWEKLYEHGIGAWPLPASVAKHLSIMQEQLPTIDWLQHNLRTYGYPIEVTEQWDAQTEAVLTAFQMHFRAENYSGKPDAQTCAILASLNERYLTGC